MWNYSFVFPDFIVLSIFLIYFFAQPRLSIKLNKSFFRILVSDFLVILSDVITTMALENAEHFAPFVLRLFNVAYFILFLFRILCFYIFTRNCIGLGNAKRLTSMLWHGLIFILAECIAVANLFTDTIFSISGQGVYARGQFYNIIYICAFYYLLLSFVEVIRHHKALSFGSFLASIAFNTMLAIGYIVRILLPQYLILNLFTLGAIIIIYLSYQNPTIYLAGKTTAFNKKALFALLGELYEEKNPLVIGFAIHNYNELREIYSGTQMDRGLSLIDLYLAKTFPCLKRFYLHDGRFMLIGDDCTQGDKIRAELTERFSKPWCADSDVDLFLEPGFAQVSPDVRNVGSKEIIKAMFSALKEVSRLNCSSVTVTTDAIITIEQNTLIKRAVEKAVEQNAVEMFLQPLMDAKTHKLIGAEALARIRNDQNELIPPVLFIPIAERNGRINILGEQMFEKACQFIHDHDLDKMGIKWINVNLSPIQFLRRDLNERFTAILKKHNVDAEKIHLEITEESMIDYTLLQKQIQTMKQTGFQFVLDDFGSGYSNVNRLKRCPFVNVKLDMGIVWDYFKEQDKILPTLVQTFKQMNFTVTAEGIETKEMAESMKQIGCDYLQGYYFCKPIPAEKFAAEFGNG